MLFCDLLKDGAHIYLVYQGKRVSSFHVLTFEIHYLKRVVEKPLLWFPVLKCSIKILPHLYIFITNVCKTYSETPNRTFKYIY